MLVGSAMKRRDVAIKILALCEYDQRQIIDAMSLEVDRNKLDYEVALSAIVAADEQGRLQEMDDAIDKFMQD